MKNKLYKYFAIASVFGMFACDSEQAGQDVSEVGPTDDLPTATFSFDSPTTVQEGDETVLTYTVNFDKPIDRPIDFVLVQTGGDAVEHEDFDFINTSVAAFDTSAELQIVIYNDDIIEGTETLTFEVQRGSSLANKYLVNPSTIFPDPVTVSIENFVSDAIQITLDWSGTYVDADGDEHSLCDLDFDLEIYTADLSTVLLNSYTSCPEMISIAPEELEDGTYWVVPSFWSNASAIPPAENFDIATTLIFNQVGAQMESISLETPWNFEAGGYAEDNIEDAYFTEYKLVVEGDSFTITDSTGNVVFEQ